MKDSPIAPVSTAGPQVSLELDVPLTLVVPVTQDQVIIVGQSSSHATQEILLVPPGYTCTPLAKLFKYSV